ncbi:myoD family inhibitor domain-containing protein isoform X4 [Bubalus bubalis]|uniref:myoD family inhibitor domain-containing protein isoform X4 n=1 Tax=Bubalus bubalis TaxID=89462 RepID=UPI001E1B636A|nr:myoD family inhibitor domain-containing protein isoform X4 [Bubalus bubalis]
MFSKNELALCVHPSCKQIQSVEKKVLLSWETSIRSLYTHKSGSSLEEKCDKENTEREITQAADSCFTHGEMQDQSIWGNCSDDELIRTQPQRLPQLQTAAQESEEEISKIKNGHPSLSNGNGIHHGAKHVSAENRRLSAPVSQKMHRKIHSSLSVNSDISKKSKVNAVFSQKTGSSPEVSVITEPGLDEVLGCCYHRHEGAHREGRVSNVSFLDKCISPCIGS